jgi:hypothetical protein
MLIIVVEKSGIFKIPDFFILLANLKITGENLIILVKNN